MKKRVDDFLATFPVIPINFLTAAVTSLILIGLSFALYLRSLGFYLDDWPQLYSLVVRGTEGIKTYFLYDDRPFGWWPDLLVFRVWGTNPIGWHLTNYLLRWLVGLGVWGVFSQMWQNHKREIFWAVQLFAVFPLFNQQSMGLTFIAHWFCYVLFFLSIYLMLVAVRKPKIRVLFIVLSFTASVFNLFTYENFIGIEFLRPVFLWLALREVPKKQRVKQTILYWLPFLTLAVFYIIWRIFLMQNIRGLDTVVVTNYLTDPLGMIQTLASFVVRDLTFMVIAVWFPTIDPSTFDLSIPNLVLSYVLTILIGAIFGLLFFKRKTKEDDSSLEDRVNFRKEILVVGLLGMLFGCAPGWMVGKSVTGSELWVDRFGLPAMWAAPLVIIWIISVIGQQKTKIREFVFIILIALAVGRNFIVTNEYRLSTVWQNRVMHQLKWRAPLVKPNTAFLSNYELFTKVGVYPTSFMLNILYPNTQELVRLDYWFFTIQKYFPDSEANLVKGMDIYSGHWYSKFAGYSSDSLVLAWNSTNPHCLWILTDADRYNPAIDETTRMVLGASNLTRIVANTEISAPDTNLFGTGDRNNWCFYYETGDLARQLKDWQQAVSLYEEAVNRGYNPMHGAELIPFIEAYAHIGKADVAAKLTELAKNQNENMENYICDTWNRLAREITGDSLFNEQYKLVSEQDACQNVK
jgi:hypothetical protein